MQLSSKKMAEKNGGKKWRKKMAEKNGGKKWRWIRRLYSGSAGVRRCGRYVRGNGTVDSRGDSVPLAGFAFQRRRHSRACDTHRVCRRRTARVRRITPPRTRAARCPVSRLAPDTRKLC